jgi:hypothetical protein
LIFDLRVIASEANGAALNGVKPAGFAEGNQSREYELDCFANKLARNDGGQVGENGGEILENNKNAHNPFPLLKGKMMEYFEYFVSAFAGIKKNVYLSSKNPPPPSTNLSRKYQ